MIFPSIHEALDPARDKAQAILHEGGHKPRIFSRDSFQQFSTNIATVANLIGEEPEILIFAAAQWLVIWLAYLAWTQMLDWIPDYVWNAIQQASREGGKAAFNLLNLALLAWSFFIVCVVSYPIGICTASMVAVHDLRACNEEVTLAKCLTVADRHLGRIWMFTAVDAWVTVKAILDRLPKKYGNRTMADELLYYAWKVATIAVVPALVNGRDFVGAGRDSLTLLRSRPAQSLGLRFGYSAVCWVIGILAYAMSLVVFAKFGHSGHEAHFIYNFYFLMAGPVFVAVGAVSVLVRPFFVLGVAKLYSNTVDVTAEIERDVKTIPSWESGLLSWKSILFLLLLCILLVAVFFPEEIGLTGWIERLARKDLFKL